MLYIKKLVSILSVSILMIMAASACQKQNDEMMSEDKMSKDTTDMTDMVEVTSALAVLEPTEGSNVSGVVYFKTMEGGIEVTADIKGLKPGKHGFHIHQFGDLRADDGTSAGGHFNPMDMKHGAPGDSVRHVGDLGNIEVSNDGTAHYERVDSLISFSGKNSILGRAIVVHVGEDDLKSQPTGDAGARAAVGIIGIANDDYSAKMDTMKTAK